MKLLTTILISIILATIVYANYISIKKINESQSYSKNEKDRFVFIILYFPIIGLIYYNFTKKF